MLARERILGILAAAALTTGVAEAQLRRQLDFSDVFERSDVAFVGRVTALSHEPHPAGRVVYTRVTFGVEDLLFDRTDSVGTSIELEFVGGRLGDRELRACGVPKFALGDEAVLFVHHDGQRRFNPIVASTGHFELRKDEVTGRRYALNAGKGSFLDGKGNLVPTAGVEAVRGGTVTYSSRSSTLARADDPSPRGGGALSSGPSTRNRAPRPAEILSVEELAAFVEKKEKTRVQQALGLEQEGENQ